MTQPSRIASLCLLCAAPLLSGCLSLGLSQSAQTLPRGQVQHQFGLEWFRTASEDASAEAYHLPFAMPFYGLRAGVADRVDLGFRTNVTFSNVGFDVKLQPVDLEHFDVAVDPTIQYAWAWGLAHLPLMIGISLSSSFQIVLSGRASYAFPLIDETDPDDLGAVFGTSSQLMAGGGLGLYARLGDRFAIMPEVQAIRGFGDTDPLTISFTLGFSFGDQPGVEPEPEPPPVAPTETAPPRPAAHPPGGQYPPPGGQYPPPAQPPPAGPQGPATTPPGYGEPGPQGGGGAR